MPSKRRTALVTGGNRGLGLETCRQLAKKGLDVILTARIGEDAEGAAGPIGSGVRACALDVTSEKSVASCTEWLRQEGIHIDVLVNNGGVYSSGGVLGNDETEFRRVMDVNFYGPLRLCKYFVPLMVQAGYGRVVNMSSGSGSFGEGLEGPAAYCISKAAFNGLTVKLAQEVTGDVKINAMCPGWVRTRMGGPNASRSVEEGADTAIWLATLPADGPNGGFFRNREPIAW